MIDPATGWFEIVDTTNKSATSVQDVFLNTWLMHYPQPLFIVFDNGSTGRFKREFKQMYIQDNYGVKVNQRKVTTNNTQANTIMKRFTKLLVVNDMLR
jgi:hypothetical protein